MIINAGCTYTASDGTLVDYSEDIRWSDKHHGKYNNGMANYLDVRGFADEETGDVDWDVYVQRFGKRLLFSDDRGFVSVDKYPTENDAIEIFDNINAEYCAWADEVDA